VARNRQGGGLDRRFLAAGHARAGSRAARSTRGPLSHMPRMSGRPRDPDATHDRAHRRMKPLDPIVEENAVLIATLYAFLHYATRPQGETLARYRPRQAAVMSYTGARRCRLFCATDGHPLPEPPAVRLWSGQRPAAVPSSAHRSRPERGG
jgi:hypothetical protein